MTHTGIEPAIGPHKNGNFFNFHQHRQIYTNALTRSIRHPTYERGSQHIFIDLLHGIEQNILEVDAILSTFQSPDRGTAIISFVVWIIKVQSHDAMIPISKTFQSIGHVT